MGIRRSDGSVNGRLLGEAAIRLLVSASLAAAVAVAVAFLGT
jgi:hypothetical protein